MLAVNQHNTFETSVKNARIVVGLEWIYVSIRDQVGKAFVVGVIVLLGMPLVFLFGYWLQRKRKKLVKRMRKGFNNFKDAKDYVEFKSKLSQLTELYTPLKKVSNYTPSMAPIPLRYTLAQMQQMSSTILNYSEWLKSKLAPLNEEHFKSVIKDLKFSSEKELWKERNSAYQYWI